AVLPRQVLARLLSCVELFRDLDRAVPVQLHEEVLKLDPDLELVALLRGLCEHVAEDRARAVRPCFPFDRYITGESSQVLLPRYEREAVEVRNRCDVGIARKL